MDTDIQVFDDDPNRWAWEMISSDGLDLSIGLGGLIFAGGFFGIPGLFLWAGFWWLGINTLRKTPVVPATIDLVQQWREDRSIVEGVFRDVVAPGFSEYTPRKPARKQNPAKRAPQAMTAILSPQPAAAEETHRPTAPARGMSDVPEPPVSSQVPRRATSDFNIREWLKQYEGVQKGLPDLTGRHVVIFGGTGGGKSSLIKHIFRQYKDATIIIADLHYEPGNWPGRAYILGKARNLNEVVAGVDAIIAELDRRIVARSEDADFQMRPIVLFLDEETTIAEDSPDTMDQVRRIAREGRKYEIFIILAPHGPNLSTLGFKRGTGDQRANFVFIEMPKVPKEAEHLPRLVTAWYGAPKDGDVLGRFVVPPPPEYTATPHFGLPRWLAAPTTGDDGEGEQDTVNQVISQAAMMTADSGAVRNDEAQFRAQYTPNAQETRKLALMLAQKGYRVRKISEFLPFMNAKAREIANTAVALANFVEEAPLPPTAGSDDEKALVLDLHRIGASKTRIAALLHGNKQVNLVRVEEYIREAA